MFKLFNYFGDKFFGQREASRKHITDTIKYLGWKKGDKYIVKKYVITGNYPDNYEETTFVTKGYINWTDRESTTYIEVDHGE